MKSFEEFKASREKMDPSTRKMSDPQWEQAYKAYRGSRERVRESVSGPTGRRRRSSGASSRRTHVPSPLSPMGELKQTVRAFSAYSDLRLIIDVLAWVAVGVIVLMAIVQIFLYTSTEGVLFALLNAVLQAIAVFILRGLAHVLVDIPDIALHRLVKENEIQGVDESGD